MDAAKQQFANLTSREDLLTDLRSLEARMKQELGQDIALIAYALPGHEGRKGSSVHDESMREGEL